MVAAVRARRRRLQKPLPKYHFPPPAPGRQAPHPIHFQHRLKRPPKGVNPRVGAVQGDLPRHSLAPRVTATPSTPRSRHPSPTTRQAPLRHRTRRFVHLRHQLRGRPELPASLAKTTPPPTRPHLAVTNPGLRHKQRQCPPATPTRGQTHSKALWNAGWTTYRLPCWLPQATSLLTL